MLKQILMVSIAILGLLFFTTTVFAQNPPNPPTGGGGEQEIARKYGISFPIKELGNCTNVSECKNFCDNPKNHQSCTDFAKKHNLSSESSKSSSTKNDEEILKLAGIEFGCNSYDACMQFCEKEENMEKCMDFAARHNLDGGNAAQMKHQMSALKNLLGCNSMKTCMDFCNSPANMQKCMEVFKQAGFSVEANYSGPGGCNSEQSCQAYCEKNPKECGGDNFQSEPPEVWCSKVASDCKWDGTTCTCGGTNSPQESGEIWCPKAGVDCKWTGTTCECLSQTYSEGLPLGTDPTEWCHQNPGKCTYQNTGDSSAECAKYGCSYDGKTCQCPSSSDTVDFSSQCLSQSGCSWDASTKICSCPAQSTSTTPADNPSVIQGGETIYKSECLAAACKWSDNPGSCDCSGVTKGVQGSSTNRSLLQQILDFILRR